MLRGHVGKWMLALRFLTPQVLANFFVDHLCVDIEENPVNFVELKSWKLFFDSSCHKKGVCIGIYYVTQ